MSMSLSQAALEIVRAGQFLSERGWAPATAGNYSMRLNNGLIGVTTSGKWKGELRPSDVMTINDDGKPEGNGIPSAEALLHTMIYKMFPSANAVLHSHSVTCVALTRILKKTRTLILEDYEMLKVFPDIKTHAVKVSVPILDNSQDIAALAKKTQNALRAAKMTPIFLIRNHGLYGWGRSMDEAKRVVEGAEYMLSCELAQLKA